MTGRGRPTRATVYDRLHRAIQELNQRLGGLPSPTEAQDIWSDIWHLEAHHSTALEGNTLVLKEVQALLDQGRAIGAKPLREYNEVKGYGDAAKWVYGQALEPDVWNDGELLNLNELRHIHNTAMTPVWDISPHPDATDREGPGNFREHDIHPFAEGMTPPSWTLLASEIQGWVGDVCGLGRKLEAKENLEHPLPEALARIHNSFERIHPFIDGNGRTGRLVLNLILVRLGYPPIIVLKKQRDTYLHALRRADAGDYGALGELIARAMEENLNRFIVPNVAGPARIVPLAALADEEFSAHALRQAAQRGRLNAVHGADGVWRSSRKSVDAYRASKHKPTKPRARRAADRPSEPPALF